MDKTFSFVITEQRHEKVKKIHDKNKSDSMADIINTAIDFYLNHLETKYLMDMMYFFGIPFFIFLTAVGITLYFSNMFFYVVSGVSGIYLVIFFYLFYNKYRGVKFGVNR